MGAAPARPVPFLGLTGGMAAGKSEALRALERLGAVTLSTDAVVHELLSGDELRPLLVERFGERVAPAGAIDRQALAAAVFERPDERKWLEGLLWPRVGARVAAWRADLERREPRPRAGVVEVPLLFESGMDAVFDATIAVVADDGIRRARLAERGHAGAEERERRQLPQDEKARRADHVVANDGSVEELERNLSRLLATIGT